MANYNRVTPRVFDAVKVLIESGSQYVEIAEHLHISTQTVGRINKAEDFTEYRNMLAVFAAQERKRRERKEAKQEPKKEETPVAAPVVIPDLKQTGGTISGAYQLNRLYEQMKQQTELLACISRKLAFIVEELGGGADDTSGKNQAVS